MADASEEQAENLRAIIEVLRRHEEGTPEEGALEHAAQEWLAAGFDDAEEVEDWLRARCLTGAGAQTLERAGFTPEQAAIRTTAGASAYEETVGFKLIKGDLSFDEARRIITSEFWNS